MKFRKTSDLIKKISSNVAAKMTLNMNPDKQNNGSIPISESGSALHYEENRLKNSFSSISEIGRGAYGCVYKALHKLEGRFYAIKKIPLKLLANEDPRQMRVFREVATMANLKHKNIVRYITSWLELNDSEDEENDDEENWDSESQFLSKNFSKQIINAGQKHSFEESFFIDFKKSSLKSNPPVEIDKSENNISLNEQVKPEKDFIRIALYIQMDFCKGMSLINYINNSSFVIGELDIYWIFIQLVEGLAFIHSKGILHRDLKPGNIFVDGKGVIKIGDFGLSTLINIELLEKGHTGKSILSNNISQTNLKSMFQKIQKEQFLDESIVGTPLYVSNENENNYLLDTKSDIYALGIVLFELLSNFKTYHEKIEEINNLKQSGCPSPSFISLHSEKADLISLMINKDSFKRPEAKEITSTSCYRIWHSNITSLIKSTEIIN